MGCYGIAAVAAKIESKHSKTFGITAMPHIEYQCNQCKKNFERVQLLGEEKKRPPCPACGSTDVRVPSTAAPLFEGIASFSSLASDRD
jgi:putative FmdB family regulatory protein